MTALEIQKIQTKLETKQTSLAKIKEELIELLEAIDSGDISNIAEETADVMIVLSKLPYLYENFDNLYKDWHCYKLERQTRRINDI